MAGNVWEWCADWYAYAYYVHAPSRNPAGPSSGNGRVLRGGSLSNDDAGRLRVAFPNGLNHDNGLHRIGLLCAVGAVR